MPNGLYSNVPEELRTLKQWCLWKYVHIEGRAKPTKVPYQPNGNKCSVTNPENFHHFDECLNALALGGYDGLGFIFTGTDYSGIDLDDPTYLADGNPNPNYQSDLNRQIKIAHEFDSYSEVSPSGKGLHIIVKGKVPDGRRTNYIELYPSGRYFTMTGQVHNAKPVGDFEPLLNQLWQQMGGVLNGSHHPIASQPETITDEEIIELARKHNAATFTDLEAGVWAGSYPSQSEADLAYMNIIAYYTNSKEQVKRIYSKSKLGSTDKKRQTARYQNTTVNEAFNLKVAPLDLGNYKDALEHKLNGPVAQRSEPIAHNGLVAGSNPAGTTNYPPGLLGEIAQFIYQSAPRPVAETALAAAIGLMAGITGRAYNISGTGLNQYVLLLAMTGTGKEAAAEGIDKLMSAIKMQVPTSTSFIGPSEIPSGSGLYKHLATSQSFLSILGEFGWRLQQLSSHNANGAELSLKRMILDLYNKSGFNRTLGASAYSRKEDSNAAVLSPAFSILGESVPEKFYNTLNEDMISDGLLPRFLLIEYKGNRPPLNQNHMSIQPSFALIEKLAALAAFCETLNHANPRRVMNVDATKTAAQMLADFNDFSDAKINSSNKDVIRQLWNRAHIKALKLSALVAVGENMTDPVVSTEGVKWAIDLVQADIASLTFKFEAGEIGTSSGELKQVKEVIRMINEYVKLSYDKVEKYINTKNPSLHSDKIIPYAYLNKRLAAASVFRLDRLGATVALKRALQILIDSDRISELGKAWCNEKYGTTQRCFSVKDLSLLDE